jgi:hypothetical protein
VQIGEQGLPAPQQAVLGRQGLFHFEHQLRVAPHLFGGADQLSAGGLEIVVGDRRPFACAGLDQHIVAVTRQFGDPGRRDRHSEFVVLELGGDPDTHARSLRRLATVGDGDEGNLRQL